MILEFNWKVKNLGGEETRVIAKNGLLTVFDFSSAKEKPYLDKKRDWARSIIKDGKIEPDETDAKKIIEWIDTADNVYDFIKIALRSYIQERIDQCTPKDKK